MTANVEEGWSLSNDWMFDDDIDKRDSELLVEEAKEKGNYKQVLNKAIIKTNEYFQMHVLKINTLKDLTALPKTNEQFRIITQQHFNTFTFIIYIIEKHKHIDELDVITFNMNEGTILALLSLLDTNVIEKLRIVISDSVKFRMPKRVEQLKQAHEERKDTGRFSVVFLWNHAKIALVKCNEEYYIIEGSGNFSSNAEIEQYVFENNKQMYFFHKKWITESLFSERQGIRAEVLD